MKNVLLAILSIAIGFVISLFTFGNPNKTESALEISENTPQASNTKDAIISDDNTFISSENSTPETVTNSDDTNIAELSTTDSETIELAKNEINQAEENDSETTVNESPELEENRNNITTNKTEAKLEYAPEETASEDSDEDVEETVTETVSDNLDEALTSYENWKAYSKKHLDLMATFIPVDEKGAKIKKGIFLTLLRTGAYLPVKSKNKEKLQYKLSELDVNIDEKIKQSIISNATSASHYFKMEGKKLPSYNFVDINGKAHNKRNTKGKFLVLKCWFITCKTCVEEFPQLNNLVDKYKNKKIEFVSLAFDEKDKLKAFLDTKTFKYSTVANQKEYMSKKLKVKQYPTHLIIDSNGVIMKMVNNVDTLTSELERIFGK